MRLFEALVGFVLVGVLVLIFLHFTAHTADEGSNGRLSEGNSNEFLALVELVKVQNETIHTLETHLKHMMSKSGDSTAEDLKLIEISDTIGRLSRENEEHRLKALHCHNLSQELEHNFDKELQQLRISALSAPSVAHCPEEHHTSSVSAATTASTMLQHDYAGWPRTSMEDHCEQRYGLELADEWRKKEEVWCTGPSEDVAMKSELKCYPYHQAHKKLDGRGPDLFCEATNFVMDFSKVGDGVYIVTFYRRCSVQLVVLGARCGCESVNPLPQSDFVLYMLLLDKRSDHQPRQACEGLGIS